MTKSGILDEIGVDAICERLAGGESLRQIARDVGVHNGTLCRWLTSDEDRAQHYARAREMAGHKAASEVMEIADDRSLGADERRVMIDARKWAAGRMAGKYYGDRQRLEHTGEDGGPVVTEIRIIGVDGDSDG